MARLGSPNTGKATIYTAGGRMSTEGPASDVVYYSFMCIPEDDRLALLAKMSDWHDQHSSEDNRSGHTDNGVDWPPGVSMPKEHE